MAKQTAVAVAQSDLFGTPQLVGHEPGREYASKGFPIEREIAKRYKRTICCACKQPIDWFPHDKVNPQLITESPNQWACGGCFTRHGGVDGVMLFMERAC